MINQIKLNYKIGENMDYIQAHSKSQVIGFILTLLFGSLGLFYSNVIMALILTVIAFTTLATVIVPVICWILSIIIGVSSVSSHNKKALAVQSMVEIREK